MKLELNFFDALCETQTFNINNIKASWLDFGEKYDRNKEIAPDYGCGDMCFIGKPATDKVLLKYKINKQEYNKIVKLLEQGLSFGMCSWCD